MTDRENADAGTSAQANGPVTQHSTHTTTRRLSDIIAGGTDALRSAWQATDAAADFAPIPAGHYTCRVVSGELVTSKSGTPGYLICFRVLDGEHAGRLLWLDLWLTAAALPMTKRDVAKLGITKLEQLEQSLPHGIRCAVKVALRTGDDGVQRNRVRAFDVLGVDTMTDADFAPAPPEAEATEAPSADDAGAAPDTLIDPSAEPPSAMEAGQ